MWGEKNFKLKCSGVKCKRLGIGGSLLWIKISSFRLGNILVCEEIWTFF